MFEKLPSLVSFQPKFYTGGPTRFHLPLFYDLVAIGKPRSVVTLGFGDGQAFFTFCQAACEQNSVCHCLAVRREHLGEEANEDVAWLEGKDYGDEFYGDSARFSSGSDAVKELADGSVDLLLLDDCDSGAEIQADLQVWEQKLSPNGLILCHGIELRRDDPPKAAWLRWAGTRRTVESPDGIGLGIARRAEADHARREDLVTKLFEGDKDLAELTELYRLAVSRIDAQARANDAARKQYALKARQVWIDSLLADRWKVQQIMDYQAGEIAELKRKFDALLTDRAKAQLIMDTQHDQLDHWIAEAETLKGQLKEQKRILSAAKSACRKKGKCFRISDGPKVKRPFREKVMRELRRIPRNLRISRASKDVASDKEETTAQKPTDRYAAWIKEHEPDVAALEEQRRLASQLRIQPKISLLVPIYNTSAFFLGELFASVVRQTYDRWELCLVDGGSDQPKTLATVQEWISREARIRFEQLGQNFGVSENTNRALKLATGDFIACVDSDDLIEPFALYEVARAINNFPDGDIFYSDEDRWTEKGKRERPFFKPEWSPELLYGSMYIGHLTAYRRALVDQVGGFFRKEFEMSGDYDFALRATERTRAIHHIPHVLYHWREHPASSSTGGKPEARKTNLAALAAAMRRRKLPAEIIEYSTANRARLIVQSWPRVSVIVPTDSPLRAEICLRDLPHQTVYPDLELVIVTNSKLLESLRGIEVQGATVRLVPYDKPFNFSDKCNAGAAAASGERLIFFNDDVETRQPDWIQNLIEPLENSEVGAVAPKLLYETGKIQHAGLVMGVRGLAGTAFHQREADTTEYYNLAQSLRDVAAVSAACLAMRRDDFVRLGGFDAVNTPIAHSDIDLSFRIREAGMRCVYTPYATLSHAGHTSIGVEERKKALLRRDKASIFLLKRFAHYSTHDPYFTDNMRDWLYTDSPTPIRMMARDRKVPVNASVDLLFVSHDLSLSGAPMMLLNAARWCQNNGIFAVVLAPKDGPLRGKFEAEGIPLIIDPLVRTGHESFVRFARDFDCIVANTIRSEAVVRAMQAQTVPVMWWLHEPGSVGEHYIREDRKLRAALPLADMLVAPSESTAEIYRPYTSRPVRCVRNAIPDPAPKQGPNGSKMGGPLRFLLLGSIEPRKGQDIFVEALATLPRGVQEAAEFQIAGRILDPKFWPKVEATAAKLKNFLVKGALDHGEALELMSQADVIVSASRDEAMPTVTILEAMSLGKAVIATMVGGAREALVEGDNSLLVRPEAPEGLASAIRRLIEDRSLAVTLGRKARATYEKNFTMERFGREFRQLIDEVISAPITAAVKPHI